MSTVIQGDVIVNGRLRPQRITLPDESINNAAIAGKLDELRREAQNWSPEDIEAYDAVIEEQNYGELITGQINAQSGGPDRYIRKYE